MKLISNLSMLAVLALPAPAFAEGHAEEYGTSVSLGGGVVQFLDSKTRELTSQGSAWEARVAFGTRKTVAVEVGYLGSLHAIDGLDTQAHLVSTTIESALRFNIGTGRIQPFVVAGAGWAYYHLTKSMAEATNDHDSILVVPLGLGVGFKERAWLCDARVIYRASELVDLFADARLDSWSATLRVGYEY